MNSIINLNGLSERQQWLAQQLWICDTLDEVADLRDSLDESMWHDLFLVMELIFLADVDSVVQTESDCPDAIDIMEKIRHESDDA
jgi:hypothetical protein